MKIGFSGTRAGMSNSQKEQFIKLLRSMQDVTEFHHGDCVGSDAEAHDLIREHFPDINIVVHPPIINSLRAFKKGDVTRPLDDYHSRDEKIVNETDILIATPMTDNEEKRSGTWYTIRYAVRKDKHVKVLAR